MSRCQASVTVARTSVPVDSAQATPAPAARTSSITTTGHALRLPDLAGAPARREAGADAGVGGPAFVTTCLLSVACWEAFVDGSANVVVMSSSVGSHMVVQPRRIESGLARQIVHALSCLCSGNG